MVLVEGLDVGEVLVVVLLEVVEVLVHLRHEELDLVVGAAPVVLDLVLELHDEGRQGRQLLLVVVRLLLDAAVDLLAHAVQVLDVRLHLAQQLVDVRLELLRPLRDRLEGLLRLLGLVRELLVELLVAGDAVGQRRVRLVADEVDALGEDLRAVHPPVDVLVGRLRSRSQPLGGLDGLVHHVAQLASLDHRSGPPLAELCDRPVRHSPRACSRASPHCLTGAPGGHPVQVYGQARCPARDERHILGRAEATGGRRVSITRCGMLRLRRGGGQGRFGSRSNCRAGGAAPTPGARAPAPRPRPSAPADSSGTSA